MTTVEVTVPVMGESLSEALVANCFVAVGDSCQENEILLELETDKVTLEIRASATGSIKHIYVKSGSTVKVGDTLIVIETKTAQSARTSSSPVTPPDTPATVPETVSSPPRPRPSQTSTNKVLPPGAARLAAQNNVNVTSIDGSGRRGQVTKSDVQRFMEPSQKKEASSVVSPVSIPPPFVGSEREKVVPMSRLRQRIAERLVEAQSTAAILTTFNEIDMHNAIEMRRCYKDRFQSEYGVSLGFMSIFVKSVIHALQFVPVLNAEIRGQDIVHKNYYDISVAVSSPKGLLVPVIRNAASLSFAEIELEIHRLANKAKEGAIELKDLEGGTFTISNGGIYGSMLSTPILNPPQSGILGMHNIVKRPVVMEETKIVVRPVMYVALSYDHRIIDGKEAVLFLLKVKEAVENPERILLGI